MKLPDPNLPENKDRVFYYAEAWFYGDEDYNIVLDEITARLSNDGKTHFWCTKRCVINDRSNDVYAASKEEAYEMLIDRLSKLKKDEYEAFKKKEILYDKIIAEVIDHQVKEFQNGN